MTPRVMKAKTVKINEEYLVLNHICHLRVGWGQDKPVIEIHFVGGSKATFPLSALEPTKGLSDEQIITRLKYHLETIKRAIENNC